MGNDFLSLISFAGGYKYRGDWLQVRGVFNRACRQHGGDMDIHAQDIIKIRSGRAVKHRLVPEKEEDSLNISRGVFMPFDWTALEQEAQDKITQAESSGALEQVKIKYLGRRGLLAGITGSIPGLPPQERPEVGKMANLLKGRD